MPAGSGLDSVIGAAPESAYGTPAVVSKFFEFESEGLELDPNYLKSTALRNSRFVSPSSRRRETSRTAAGPVVMEVPSKGFGPWLNCLHGDTVVPVETPAASGAYKQTHTFGRTHPNGKSMTIGKGIVDAETLTRRWFHYPGSKLTSAEFRAAREDWLKATLQVDARDEDKTIAAPTISYPAGIDGFVFENADLLVNGQHLAVVSDFTLTLPLAMNTERKSMDTTGLKREPRLNAYAAPTAAISAEFSDLTTYDLWRAGTIVALVATFKGITNIGTSTTPPTLKFTCAATAVNGETPKVAGPDIVAQNVPVEILDDGTNPPVLIEYTSADATL